MRLWEELRLVSLAEEGDLRYICLTEYQKAQQLQQGDLQSGSGQPQNFQELYMEKIDRQKDNHAKKEISRFFKSSGANIPLRKHHPITQPRSSCLPNPNDQMRLSLLNR